ncbi:MAG: hypothetical protein NT031_10145, partial [Planctomycetota bacterium]|nr:hypothetical protein [Planctomycetota bacterium]
MIRSGATFTRKQVLVLAGVLALVSGVMGAAWYWPAKNWGVVDPGAIFRSGQMPPWQVKRVLQENGI